MCQDHLYNQYDEASKTLKGLKVPKTQLNLTNIGQILKSNLDYTWRKADHRAIS